MGVPSVIMPTNRPRPQQTNKLNLTYLQKMFSVIKTKKKNELFFFTFELVLSVQKGSLYSSVPSCQPHIKTHHFQAFADRCLEHAVLYTGYIAQNEEVAMCRYFCFSSCAISQGYGVCSIDIASGWYKAHADEVSGIEYKTLKSCCTSWSQKNEEVEKEVDQLKAEVYRQYQKN